MMIISMQGKWKLSVKSRNADRPQRFIVQGAVSGNGIYSDEEDIITEVDGKQWSISIQNESDKVWKASYPKLNPPINQAQKVEFTIEVSLSKTEEKVSSLVLLCSTDQARNDHFIYGQVYYYHKSSVFNPGYAYPFAIDTQHGFEKATKNPVLRKWLEDNYPDCFIPNNAHQKSNFKPILVDVSGIRLMQQSIPSHLLAQPYIQSNMLMEGLAAEKTASYKLLHEESEEVQEMSVSSTSGNRELVKNIQPFIEKSKCFPASDLTLTFESYWRTIAERTGAAYEGAGERDLLGDTITDRNGNYLFRLQLPDKIEGREDFLFSSKTNNFELIFKVIEFSPCQIRYESAPKSIGSAFELLNLYIPEDNFSLPKWKPQENLIEAIGNIRLGGKQNSSLLSNVEKLKRKGYENLLDEDGTITVSDPMANFSIHKGAWSGTLDLKGCLFDECQPSESKKIKWYTVSIRREEVDEWLYINENLKHPKYSNRSSCNYLGDDVGPFYPNVGGILNGRTPAYQNIQQQIAIEGIDWESGGAFRFLRLTTSLYDAEGGIRKPGLFFLKVEGFDSEGKEIEGAKDMIALFVHNNGIQFHLTKPKPQDDSIIHAGSHLYRLEQIQLKTPIKFSFEAQDPFGFIDRYQLSIERCPATDIELSSSIVSTFKMLGEYNFPIGKIDGKVNVQEQSYAGTKDDFCKTGLIQVTLQPLPIGDGWIKVGEYFSSYIFKLIAQQRITNGDTFGLAQPHFSSEQIMLELLYE